MQEILNAPTENDFQITILKLEASGDDDDYRPMLKEIKNKAGVSRIIIDCDYKKVNTVLKQVMSARLACKSFFLKLEPVNICVKLA